MSLTTQLTPDINFQLKDSGVIAATAAWQVSASNQIVDLNVGAPAATTGTFAKLKANIEVSAVEIASNDELYRLQIQGSTSATFASTIVTLASLELGANEVLVAGVDVDSVVGQYVLYFTNDVAGTVYRYIRGVSTISGTIATGINHQAWVTHMTG